MLFSWIPPNKFLILFIKLYYLPSLSKEMSRPDSEIFVAVERQGILISAKEDITWKPSVG
jgi:hypothetical protein